MIPEFAVLGHPNEGKSSVVSTLTEDDRIKVSVIPGETTVSRRYTVKIDGREIVRFVDTPGFQVPQQTLAWFRTFAGDTAKIVDRFIEAHKNDPFFADECELLDPVAKGAGIIYVVDGSRPVRGDDLAEMEILRLTGRPRMAIINSKADEKDYTRDWNLEFRKHFNAIRKFNSNTANFTERIRMLESLRAIDQEWEPALSRVILAFKNDWQKRNRLAASLLIQTIEKSLLFSVSEPLRSSSDQEEIKTRLTEKYQAHIREIETQMFKKIRVLFKHTFFEYQLTAYSVLKHDLFSRQTWELLGLTKEQLAAAGALIGGTMGAVIDTAAAGITFGVFTALGGIIGAGSALFGGKKITDKKPAGIWLGGDKLQLGPQKNIQFFYILMDRAFIYYSHIINRAHGRRDMQEQPEKGEKEKKGYSAGLTPDQRTVCTRFFKTMTGWSFGRSFSKDKTAINRFEELIESVLNDISGAT